jgi:hypothetical protein
MLSYTGAYGLQNRLDYKTIPLPACEEKGVEI